MRFRRLKGEYLSEKIPSHDSVTKLPSFDVAESLKAFCEEYLRAAVTVEIENSPPGYVMLSDYYTAYAIKLMVKYSMDKGVLKIRIGGEDRLIIAARFAGGLPEENDMANIFAAARRAGLEANIGDGSIVLTAPIVESKVINIYSRRVLVLYKALYDAFNFQNQ